MTLFLSLIQVSEAKQVIQSIAPKISQETIPLHLACNRILAKDVVSTSDVPCFSRSVVDGYAVLGSDTTGSGESMPAMLKLTGRVNMGSSTTEKVVAGTCVYVPTGGILPNGADSVVMIEHCEQLGDEVLVKKPVPTGENIISRGEDFVSGETVIPKGKRLSPRELGVIASAGCSRVEVSGIPKIGIISTGNELVNVDETPKCAEVRDSNTYLCAGFATENGAEPVIYGIVRDDREALKTVLERALLECDMVLISGGSSKDDRDMCADVVASRGEVLVHGIAIAPGKPTIIGKADNKPVIGLPGHPASAYVVLIALVKDLISEITGWKREELTQTAKLTKQIPSARGREDYIRVELNGKTATPVFGKSGLLNTLVKSNGVVRVPASSEGYAAGTETEVILW